MVSVRVRVTFLPAMLTLPVIASPGAIVIETFRTGAGSSSYQADSWGAPDALQSNSVPSCSIARELAA